MGCYWRSAILTLLFLLYTRGSADGHSLILNEDDCSTSHAVSVHGDLLVSASWVDIHQSCNVEFYTEDPLSTVILSFDDNDKQDNYNHHPEMTVSFYSVDGTKRKLIDSYSLSNWSSMSTESVTQPETSRLQLVLSVGEIGNEWSLSFQLTAKSGPISDYPVSLAAGVFALSLGGTVVIGLLMVCCWCCCCKKRPTVGENSARRRRRMIDQLAKEGYSVSRDYGSVGSTTPFIRNDGLVVDIFSHPDAQLQPPQGPSSYQQPPGASNYQPPYGATNYQQPRGASNHDPPPAYASVEAQRRPAPKQYVSPNVTRPSVPQQPTVPEAVLVDIDGNDPPLASAPSVEDIHQDLIEFGTPPEQPTSPVDLLCSSSGANDNPPPIVAQTN